FFLRLQEQDVVARADRGRGRFRSFLLGVLKRVLADRGRQARGPTQGLSIESLIGDEERSYEPATDETPEEGFERRWADGVWQRVLTELRQRYQDEGRLEWFAIFRDYHLTEGKRPSQQALAERHGLSPDQVGDVLDKVKKRLERLVRAELREEGVGEQD